MTTISVLLPEAQLPLLRPPPRSSSPSPNRITTKTDAWPTESFHIPCFSSCLGIHPSKSLTSRSPPMQRESHAPFRRWMRDLLWWPSSLERISTTPTPDQTPGSLSVGAICSTPPFSFFSFLLLLRSTVFGKQDVYYSMRMETPGFCRPIRIESGVHSAGLAIQPNTHHTL